MTGPIPDAAVALFRAGRGRHTNHINAGECCVRAGLAAAAPLLAAAALAKAAATLRAADLDDWPGGRYGDVAGCRDRAVAIVERLLADELARATSDGGTDG